MIWTGPCCRRGTFSMIDVLCSLKHVSMTLEHLCGENRSPTPLECKHLNPEVTTPFWQWFHSMIAGTPEDRSTYASWLAPGKHVLMWRNRIFGSATTWMFKAQTFFLQINAVSPNPLILLQLIGIRVPSIAPTQFGKFASWKKSAFKERRVSASFGNMMYSIVELLAPHTSWTILLTDARKMPCKSPTSEYKSPFPVSLCHKHLVLYKYVIYKQHKVICLIKYECNNKKKW